MDKSVPPSSVRIDKWLWAARFFKTRNLAKQAIEGGKVHLDGKRVKSSKELAVGVTLTIRQGWDQKDVMVLALSVQRRGAAEASKLYQETEKSIAKRQLVKEQKKAMGAMEIKGPTKPTTKQRRKIQQLKRDLLS